MKQPQNISSSEKPEDNAVLLDAELFLNEDLLKKLLNQLRKLDLTTLVVQKTENSALTNNISSSTKDFKIIPLENKGYPNVNPLIHCTANNGQINITNLSSNSKKYNTMQQNVIKNIAAHERSAKIYDTVSTVTGIGGVVTGIATIIVSFLTLGVGGLGFLAFSGILLLISHETTKAAAKRTSSAVALKKLSFFDSNNKDGAKGTQIPQGSSETTSLLSAAVV